MSATLEEQAMDYLVLCSYFRFQYIPQNYLILISFLGTERTSHGHKIKNQGEWDLEIWEATPQNYSDHSENPETADPATDRREYYYYEVEPHLAGSELVSRLIHLAGME